MTYFVCIGIKDDAIETLEPLKNFHLADITDAPIGRATLGAAGSGRAFLVTIRGDATDIVRPRSARTKIKEEFSSGIAQITELRHSIYYVFHLFSGRIDEEKLEIKRNERIDADNFLSDFGSLEEDVRYVITKRK